MSSNNRGSMFAAVLVVVSGGVVWFMAGAPESTAKNWLILAWILLTGALTARALAPKPVPRAMTFALAGVAVAVVVWAWLAGVQERDLTTPFIPLAIGAAGMAWRWPGAVEPGGSKQQLD